MIKSTFYHLPQEKKSRIINAIKKELSEYSGEKISINRIVKEANISRGSFYQYFDDKLDIIDLIIADLAEQITEFAKNSLNNNDGNIFDVTVELYDKIIDIINCKNEKNFSKNLFLSLRANQDLFADFMRYRFPANDFETTLKTIADSYINPVYLNCTTKDEIIYIISILNTITKNSIMSIFVLQNDAEKEREIFLKKLELLKNGFEAKK